MIFVAILDLIVGAASRHLLGNQAPARAILEKETFQAKVFSNCPRLLVYFWVDLTLPSLATLHARASSKLKCNPCPFFRALLLYDGLQFLVFFFTPWSLINAAQPFQLEVVASRICL